MLDLHDVLPSSRDATALAALVTGWPARDASEQAAADLLADTIAGACVVADRSLASDVVALRATVTCDELPAGSRRTATLVHPSHADASRAHVPVFALAHPECPIEQQVKSAHAHVQASLLGEAWRRHPPAGEGAMIVADPDGVRVPGRSEGALRPVVEAFRQRFGGDVVVGAPRVRYVHRPRLAEPWMTVLASGPDAFAPPILRDLARRKARVLRVEQHRGPFVLEAEAPLANLPGYADWLDDLAEGRADLSMWLARYVPVEVGGGPDAA